MGKRERDAGTQGGQLGHSGAQRTPGYLLTVIDTFWSSSNITLC